MPKLEKPRDVGQTGQSAVPEIALLNQADPKRAPGSSLEATRAFLAKQEAVVSRGRASADRTVQAATELVARDEEKVAAVLRRIQTAPSLPGKESLSVVSIQRETAVPEMPSRLKRFVSRLKFWENRLPTLAETQATLRTLLAQGRYDEAYGKVAPKLVSKIGIHDQVEWSAAFADIVREHVAALIREGNGTGLTQLLHSDMAYLGTEVLLETRGLLPDELRNPEIQGVIVREMIAWVGQFVGAGNFIEAYVKKRDALAAKGLLSAETINRLPAVREKMRTEIIQSIRRAQDKYGDFTALPMAELAVLKDEWDSAGVFALAEIAAWPEMKHYSLN